MGFRGTNKEGRPGQLPQKTGGYYRFSFRASTVNLNFLSGLPLLSPYGDPDSITPVGDEDGVLLLPWYWTGSTYKSSQVAVKTVLLSVWWNHTDYDFGAGPDVVARIKQKGDTNYNYPEYLVEEKLTQVPELVDCDDTTDNRATIAGELTNQVYIGEKPGKLLVTADIEDVPLITTICDEGLKGEIIVKPVKIETTSGTATAKDLDVIRENISSDFDEFVVEYVE